MKILPLVGCALLATSALAQQKPRSGYETLVAAGKLVKPGGGGPAVAKRLNLSPQDNLRLERPAVARNAPALKLLREALKLPVTMPLPDLSSFSVNEMRVETNNWQLVDQLRQESDVRLADGDALGALDSRLTIFQLTHAITRGVPFRAWDRSSFGEDAAREDFGFIAAKLDAAQTRAALAQFKAIDALRPTFVEILQADKRDTLRKKVHSLTTFLIPEAKWRLSKSYSKAKVTWGKEMSEQTAREVSALTPALLTRQISAVFDAAIARGRLPYASAIKATLPLAPTQIAREATDLIRNPKTRASYEIKRAQAALFAGALELRAIKLETGAYPANFTPPLDPFSANQPLIYKLDGEKYLLYSIGPDARDDGGAPPLETNRQTGVKTVAERVTEDSRGDLLAPVF